MDNVSLAAIGAAAFTILSSAHTQLITVPHCRGIIALSFGKSPCIPVDPEKYPDWECRALQEYKLMEEDYHDRCIAHNTGGSSGYYCSCGTSSRYAGGSVKVSETEIFENPTPWYNDIATSRCPGCRDEHKTPQPVCPFCGEAHG